MEFSSKNHPWRGLPARLLSDNPLEVTKSQATLCCDYGGRFMCGIVGYAGFKEAEPLLIEGLRRLEYRGYDSAGIATLTGPQLHLRKRAGRIAELAKHLRGHPAPGTVGICHTRWATHGPAT